MCIPTTIGPDPPPRVVTEVTAVMTLMPVNAELLYRWRGTPECAYPYLIQLLAIKLFYIINTIIISM
jgi:hypothetical protein